MATNYFCNPGAADDTGDGTTMATAKKLLNSAVNLCSAGDAVRIRASSTTALSGTLTFTNASATVATSADLTAALAAGDYIRLDASTSSPDARMWWRVASLNSTTITLAYAYYHSSGTAPAAGAASKLVPYASSGESIAAKSGSEAGGMITVTGGWDAAGTSQTGETWFAQSGTIDTGTGITCSASYILLPDTTIGVCSYGVGWLFSGANTVVSGGVMASGIKPAGAYNNIGINRTASPVHIANAYCAGCATGYGSTSSTIVQDGLTRSVYVYGCAYHYFFQSEVSPDHGIVYLEGRGGQGYWYGVSSLTFGKSLLRDHTAINNNQSTPCARYGELDDGAATSRAVISHVRACHLGQQGGSLYVRTPYYLLDTVTGRGGSGWCYRIDPANKRIAGVVMLPPIPIPSGKTSVSVSFYQCSTSAAGSTVPGVELVLFQPNGLTISSGGTVTVTDVAAAWDGNETQHTVSFSGTTSYNGVIQLAALVTDNSAGDALWYLDDVTWSYA